MGIGHIGHYYCPQHIAHIPIFVCMYICICIHVYVLKMEKSIDMSYCRPSLPTADITINQSKSDKVNCILFTVARKCLKYFHLILSEMLVEKEEI